MSSKIFTAIAGIGVYVAVVAVLAVVLPAALVGVFSLTFIAGGNYLADRQSSRRKAVDAKARVASVVTVDRPATGSVDVSGPGVSPLGTGGIPHSSEPQGPVAPRHAPQAPWEIS